VIGVGGGVDDLIPLVRMKVNSFLVAQYVKIGITEFGI
jgi:hypothetical protein